MVDRKCVKTSAKTWPLSLTLSRAIQIAIGWVKNIGQGWQTYKSTISIWTYNILVNLEFFCKLFYEIQKVFFIKNQTKYLVLQSNYYCKFKSGVIKLSFFRNGFGNPDSANMWPQWFLAHFIYIHTFSPFLAILPSPLKPPTAIFDPNLKWFHALSLSSTPDWINDP